MENNVYYVYEYIRLDYNEPFYIGMGKNNRYLDIKNKRNRYFENIVKSTPVAVSILHDKLDKDTALKYECWYIWLLRDNLGYNLSNMTDGGEGGDTLSYMDPIRLEQYRKNMSIKLKGRKLTEEHKEKISKALKGREFSDITREKIRLSRLGKKHTKEYKDYMKKINTGINNPMYDRKQSKESRLKISKNNKKKILLVKDGKVVMEFESSKEACNGEWRKKLLKDRFGSNFLSKCLNNNCEFEGYKLIYKKRDNK